MKMLIEDIRYTFRMLAKRPLFTLSVLLILALAIGSTTSVFSLANAIFFESAPYEDPERLVQMFVSNPDQGLVRESLSFPEFREWRERNRSFVDIGGFSEWHHLNLTGGGRPERLRAGYATASFFEVLGVDPQLGRFFTAEEENEAGAHPVALLSHGLWQRRFAGDADILGRDLRLSGVAYTVIGVLPPEFTTFYDLQPPEVWVPTAMIPVHLGLPDYLEVLSNRWLTPIGRLKPGVRLEQAQADMLEISQEMGRLYPETNKGVEAELVSWDYIRSNEGRLTRALRILVLGAGFVFFLGCINLVVLLWARFNERRQEVAVRLAIGANRNRMIRQIVTENLLISLLGGALGFVLAVWATRGLFASNPLRVPDYVEIDVDFATFFAALALAIVAGVALSLFLALLSARRDFHDALRPGARSSERPGRRLGTQALVIAQIAFSVMLLTGAGLMYRSFQAFRSVDLGFNVDRLLTMQIEASGERHQDDVERYNFFQQVISRMEALPGVRSAALWGPSRPDNAQYFNNLLPEGVARDTANEVNSFLFLVSSGALEKMDMTILDGRDFDATDTADSSLVAIVSESLAETMWPGERAVGKRFLRYMREPAYTVVGVVNDAIHQGREEEFLDTLYVYYPLAQRPFALTTLLVRTDVDDAVSVMPQVRAVMKELDAELPLFDVKTMAERLRDEENQIRFNTILMAFFALTAILLTAMGVYGVMSFAASRRSREIGIRVALGAPKDSVLWMIARRLVLDLGLGIVLGLIGVATLTRLIESSLYQVTPADPVVYTVLVPAVLLIGLLASFVPVRRSLTVDPIEVLREE